MATGIQSINNRLTYTVRLVEGALAANGVPTGAPLAVPTAGRGFLISSLGSGYSMPPECTVWIYTTAGSGVMTIAASRAWGFLYTSETAGLWFPLGTGTEVTAGLLNSGTGYAETSSDQISRVETLYLPGHLDGIYIELGAIAGVATAATVDAKLSRHIVH